MVIPAGICVLGKTEAASVISLLFLEDHRTIIRNAILKIANLVYVKVNKASPKIKYFFMKFQQISVKNRMHWNSVLKKRFLKHI